jgi:hypothetical protein
MGKIELINTVIYNLVNNVSPCFTSTWVCLASDGFVDETRRRIIIIDYSNIKSNVQSKVWNNNRLQLISILKRM